MRDHLKPPPDFPTDNEPLVKARAAIVGVWHELRAERRHWTLYEFGIKEKGLMRALRAFDAAATEPTL